MKAVRSARRLRKRLTDAEAVLWHDLRNRKLRGWKFRRQHPIGPYVADFACPGAGVVVELDGGQHAGARERDRTRDQALHHAGYTVLRFWNNEVFENLDGVLMRIAEVLEGQTTSSTGNEQLSDTSS